MNRAALSAPILVFLVWLAVWVIALYLVVRVLRAIERGVAAHERLADAIARQAPEPVRPRFDERAT